MESIDEDMMAVKATNSAGGILGAALWRKGLPGKQLFVHDSERITWPEGTRMDRIDEIISLLELNVDHAVPSELNSLPVYSGTEKLGHRSWRAICGL